MISSLQRKVIGQPAAVNTIIPFIQLHQAGLAPKGRPLGVFLLLGPTGTGKTKTVEALAELLHGDSQKMVKVDCGEFQMEHEVARIVGAPPGYLGHKETAPMFTQQKLTAATSDKCDLTVLLFDEIEKAAPSLTRLMLGILDKATLRLGDNTTVDFEKTIIFLTSNLGASGMAREMKPGFGFEGMVPAADIDSKAHKLEQIGMAAMRKRFAPEFCNRIDNVITYQPLSPAALATILDHAISDLQTHIEQRMGLRAFRLDVPQRTRRHLLEAGTSQEYGARELKRTLHRHIMQPLAAMVASGAVRPRETIRAEINKDRLVLRPAEFEDLRPAA